MPSVTRFSVSATGTAGIAPAARLQRRQQGRDGPCGISGRAASCTRTTSGAVGCQRLQSGAHAVLRGSCRRQPAAGVAGRSSAASIAAASPTGCSSVDVCSQRLGGDGGSPACRPAARTASASRRRTGCRSRLPPGSLRPALRHRCRADGPASIGNRHGGRGILFLKETSWSVQHAPRLLDSFRIASGRRVGNLPNRWASVIATPQSRPLRSATDRPRQWRANRHAGHPGADVRCHRSAVPPPRQAAWRRHGGVGDDRLLGDDPGEPQDPGDGRDGRLRRHQRAAARRLRARGDGRGGAAGGGSRAPT